MFIQTELTPNPDVIKFLPGQPVSPSRSFEITSQDKAGLSPLADSLFQIEGVSRVYLGKDFISVTKHPGIHEWDQIKAPILATIMDHYVQNRPIYSSEASDLKTPNLKNLEDFETDDETIANIKKLLETHIRPAVERDGGDIVFDRFERDTGILWLHLKGACSGCPSSQVTLKSGVENLFRHYIPEIIRVEQVLEA